MIHRLWEAWEVMDSLRLRLLHLEIGFKVREMEGKKSRVCMGVRVHLCQPFSIWQYEYS